MDQSIATLIDINLNSSVHFRTEIQRFPLCHSRMQIWHMTKRLTEEMMLSGNASV